MLGGDCKGYLDILEEATLKKENKKLIAGREAGKLKAIYDGCGSCAL